jgi:hypothetical protein
MRPASNVKRRSLRFPTAVKGFYYVGAKEGKGKECTILNISLNGAGLEFYTPESVEVNSKLFLEIFSTNNREDIFNIEGIVRWANQGRKDCVCGIQLTKRLEEGKLSMLMGRKSTEI